MPDRRQGDRRQGAEHKKITIQLSTALYIIGVVFIACIAVVGIFFVGKAQHNKGYDEGYTKGFSVGNDVGYDRGFDEAYSIYNYDEYYYDDEYDYEEEPEYYESEDEAEQSNDTSEEAPLTNINVVPE